MRWMRGFTRVSWVVLLGTIGGLSSGTLKAGPNLVAVGSFDLPYQEAEARESLSENEIYYEFEGNHDFGRVVVKTTTPHSLVRTGDDRLRVYYTGRGVLIDYRNARLDNPEVSIWLRLEGKLRPGRTYEYVFSLGTLNESYDGTIPAYVPAFWADGEFKGTRVELSRPRQGLEAAERIQRELYTRGKVRLDDFEHMTGGAWIIIEIPPGVGEGLGIGWVSFREIDEDLIAGKEPEMPVPVRYIPISNPLEGRVEEILEYSSYALYRLQNEDYSWGSGDANAVAVTTSNAVQSLSEWPLSPDPDNPDDARLRLDFENRRSRARDFLVGLRLEDDDKGPRNLTTTPGVAARLIALSRAPNASSYKRAISSDIRWLTDAQLDDGGWGELSPEFEREQAHLLRSDNASTELALTALREAYFAGFPCDRRVWLSAAKYIVEAQAIDGGFRSKLDEYGGLGEATNVLRTASGLSSMLTIADIGYGAMGNSCTNYMANRTLNRGIEDAIAWMNTNYGEFFKDVADFDPNAGSNPFIVSEAMQRLGKASGITRFNDHDHFEYQAIGERGEGFLRFFDLSSGLFANDIGWTAVAHRILSAGAAPRVIQRIVVGGDPAMQNNGDVHHLVRYFMKQRGQPLNWVRASIDDSARDLLRVPMLLLKIEGPFEWSDEQWSKIRNYCLNGGVAILEVGEEAARLRDQVESKLREVFPEFELAALTKDDPVYSLDGGMTWVPKAKVISNGFRSFLYMPSESWSCTWLQNQVETNPSPFKFMNQLLTVTTGEETLRGSFDTPTYEIGAKPDRDMTMAYLESGSSTAAYPNAIESLDRLMQANYRVRMKPVSDPSKETPELLWIAKTGPQPMSAETKRTVNSVIRAGGFVFADVVSGNENWAEQLSADMIKLDSSITLTRLRESEAVFTGEISGTQGFDVRRVTLRKALHTRFTETGRSDLYAIMKNDKMVGVLSHHDVVSGLGYHLFPNCRGAMPFEARKLAMNVTLVAMSKDRTVQGLQASR